MFLTDKLLVWLVVILLAISVGLFTWGKYNSFMWGTAKAKINAVKSQIDGLITEKNVYKRNFLKLNEAIKTHIAKGECDIPFVIDDDDDDGRKPWFPWNRDENLEWNPGDDIPEYESNSNNLVDILKIKRKCYCEDCSCTKEDNCGCNKWKK